MRKKLEEERRKIKPKKLENTKFKNFDKNEKSIRIFILILKTFSHQKEEEKN